MGPLAHHAFVSLISGDRIVIIGRLRQRENSPGRTSYDVILEDLGASLAFNDGTIVEPESSGQELVAATKEA